MGDASLAAFLRKTFSERSQQLLSGSLKAPDGAALQRVLSKLDEEEKTCECCGWYGCWGEAQRAWGVVVVSKRMAERHCSRHEQAKHRRKSNWRYILAVNRIYLCEVMHRVPCPGSAPVSFAFLFAFTVTAADLLICPKGFMLTPPSCCYCRYCCCNCCCYCSV
jgi:hypothetical protein